MNKLLMLTVKAMLLILSLSLLESCGGGGGGAGGNGGGAPVAQGTTVSPVLIALNTPYAGSVDTMASYYTVPVTSGQQYTVTVSGMTDDVDLVVFRSNDWSSLLSCSSMTEGVVNEECDPIATGTTALYIMVIGQYSNAGAFYTITVTPTPPATPTGVVAIAGNGQATISWSNVTGATSYNIYFSQTSGAGTGGTKITSVTSPYVHSGRTNGVTYYYVVTAVKSGLESTASGQVSATPSATALIPPQTFNFDNGTLQGWSATGAWGLTSAVTYSSSAYAITDSPAGSYNNSTNTSITSPMFDLAGTTSPSLSFYHRYSIEDSFDSGYVEVSTDGGVNFVNITPGVQYYSGYLATFTKVTIDLSSYKTNAVVIRFRLTSDFSGAYDGWYIDDIVVQ
jgi:hypothetical protein